MAVPRSRSQKLVKPPTAPLTAEQVVTEVRRMIKHGELRPGDRLPAERQLAKRLGISRPSLRAGLRSLQAMGVLRSRHGAGTFIADGPPALTSEPLSLLAALHRFTDDDLFEARRVLEVALAGLAAERRTDEHLAALAEEVAEMYATVDNPQHYLIHDVRFHRAVAAAGGNPILSALMEMVTAVLYDVRSETISRARDFKESLAMHRRIYRAVRTNNPEEARSAMSEHLLRARRAIASEEVAEKVRRGVKPRGKGSGRKQRHS
ncbi:MAG TPA: FadR/GntR family transcriptional regulator [Blastocatellia bacterium]|nr:FadR/GntR family transcriptional regulator [Blastocatellia bacterium]